MVSLSPSTSETTAKTASEDSVPSLPVFASEIKSAGWLTIDHHRIGSGDRLLSPRRRLPSI